MLKYCCFNSHKHIENISKRKHRLKSRPQMLQMHLNGGKLWIAYDKSQSSQTKGQYELSSSHSILAVSFLFVSVVFVFRILCHCCACIFPCRMNDISRPFFCNLPCPFFLCVPPFHVFPTRFRGTHSSSVIHSNSKSFLLCTRSPISRDSSLSPFANHPTKAETKLKKMVVGKRPLARVTFERK